jgi:hypothetical protein
MTDAEKIEDRHDELVPDPQVWNELGITSMTGWRYTNDPQLNFPPPIKIRTRNFRSRRMLEDFKQRMLRLTLAERAAQHRRARTMLDFDNVVVGDD